MLIRTLFLIAWTFCCAGRTQTPAEFILAGDWKVQVTVTQPKLRTTTLRVKPPLVVSVKSEKYGPLPVFNPQAPAWIKGAQLSGVKAQETTTPGLLDTNSFVLRDGPNRDARVFKRGIDYEIDPFWGTFGRLTNGAIEANQAVFANYKHALSRLDAVVQTIRGRIILREGESRAAAPVPPRIKNGERHLGNVWVSGSITKLAEENLFPILETAYVEPTKGKPSVAEQLLPKTMAKLRSGERLRILAWGDSVTVGTYLPDWEHNRWQEQFVARLRDRFPRANIELTTEAWGGRNTGSYLSEPPGSVHNYEEKVLKVKPDLIVSEFVNDAGLSPKQVEERYGKLLADFKGIGAEWIILTPHYVRPDWMGLTQQKNIDDDPRPYVAGVREFSGKNSVALADASRRYGRLWRQGIPYNTLMLNSINHPDARGMKIFADSLMELFP